MPLPFSVRRDAIEPTIVTSSPSRIQTAPRPITTRQWKLDHGSRSSRPGMLVSIVAVVAFKWAGDYPTRETAILLHVAPIACTLLGHRHRFTAEAETMRWACERCGILG